MPYLRNKRTGETVFVPDGPQQVAAPNPLKVQGAAADIGSTQASTARTRGQESRDAALFEAERRKTMADAVKAEIEAQKARQAPQVDPQVAQRLANLRALEQQIGRVRELYGKGPGATKGIAGITDYLPTPANKQFDVAGAGLGELGLAAFRVPGVGSQSDAELRAFVEANKPSSSDYDTAILEKLRNLQNRVGQTYTALGVKPQGKKPAKQQSRTIDFNDLPD